MIGREVNFFFKAYFQNRTCNGEPVARSVCFCVAAFCLVYA